MEDMKPANGHGHMRSPSKSKSGQALLGEDPDEGEVVWSLGEASADSIELGDKSQQDEEDDEDFGPLVSSKAGKSTP